MLSLAVFYFVFLGTEYLFDNRVALYTDPTGVVLAQSYILGVSALGFLAYSLIEKWISKSGNPTAFKAAGFFLSVPVIAGYILLFAGDGYRVLLGSGCFLFLILGYLGSRIHYLAAQLLRGSRHPAKTVSVAYAVGVLLQFLNHNLLWGETVEGIFLAVSFVVLWVLTVGMEQSALPGYHRRQNAEDGETVSVKNAQEGIAAERISWKNPRLAGVALLVTVVLMTCIFATLDNAVTLAHAAGTMDIGQWPRLFLALSGLLAGVLFDLNNGRYRGLIMYAVTILSTIHHMCADHRKRRIVSAGTVDLLCVCGIFRGVFYERIFPAVLSHAGWQAMGRYGKSGEQSGRCDHRSSFRKPAEWRKSYPDGSTGTGAVRADQCGATVVL